MVNETRRDSQSFSGFPNRSESPEPKYKESILSIPVCVPKSVLRNRKIKHQPRHDTQECEVAQTVLRKTRSAPPSPRHKSWGVEDSFNNAMIHLLPHLNDRKLST